MVAAAARSRQSSASIDRGGRTRARRLGKDRFRRRRERRRCGGVCLGARRVPGVDRFRFDDGLERRAFVHRRALVGRVGGWKRRHRVVVRFAFRLGGDGCRLGVGGGEQRADRRREAGLRGGALGFGDEREAALRVVVAVEAEGEHPALGRDDARRGVPARSYHRLALDEDGAGVGGPARDRGVAF
jgi:hypothetical protein